MLLTEDIKMTTSVKALRKALKELHKAHGDIEIVVDSKLDQDNYLLLMEVGVLINNVGKKKAVLTVAAPSEAAEYVAQRALALMEATPEEVH
jgi:hypothetical protein